MTKIILNGREVEADPDKPLIHACHEEGVEVPHYCYHPGLTPEGSCRICQVEITEGDRPPRVVASCRTPVTEGMVVDTEAQAAHDTRRECLEFLLKNHPLDCPICDKAGECTLQDYSFAEGQTKGETAEPRRKLEKRKDLGDVILLDQERCILCTRCVRFQEEVTKKPELTNAGLASKTVITTFGDRPLTGNYQGNLADICPVGALTLKEFRFQARVWNLEKAPSVCGECSRGCAISVEVLRRDAVKRVRPLYDPEVNTWWMCDTGRFTFEHLNDAERLTGGLVAQGDSLLGVTASEAIAHAGGVLSGGGAAVVLGTPWLTREEAAALAGLADALGARKAYVSPADNELKDDLLHTGDPAPNRRGLDEAGWEALPAAEAAEAVAGADRAVLAGERVLALLGDEPLGTTPLVTLDTHACLAAGVEACLAAPYHVEKTGTWVNVDGIERHLTVARQAPAGVDPLEDTLARLTDALSTPSEAAQGAGA